MPYDFGYGYEKVDVPELDAFLSEMNALCQKHGIGFEWESGYGDESGRVIVVPADENDLDFLFSDLDEYGGGIPFLDAAKARAKQAHEERLRLERAARAAEAEQAAAASAAAKAAREEKMKRDGVALSDGVYRLVKIATN